MAVGALKRYGVFAGQVFGAACLGGVLAAVLEYVYGAVGGHGPFWGQPRFAYQLVLGAEALWAAFWSGLVFVAGGSIYYLAAVKRGPVRLESPPLLILAVAVSGASFFYFLTTGNYMSFWLKPLPVVLGTYLLALAVWFLAGGLIYALANALRRRLAAGNAMARILLLVVAAGLLAPFIAAEGWAMWNAREPSPRRPDIYLVVMDAFRADRLSYYDAPRYLAPTMEMYGVGATVFTEAYGVSSWTKPSVASLFTGVYPGAHGVTGNIYPLPDEAVTLAEVMRDGGYRTICVSANPNVTRSGHMDAGFDIMDDVMHGPVFNAVGPPTSCMRPLLGFVALRPLLGPLFVLSTDGVKVNARLAFWSRFVGDRPVFYYVHYMEPHIPNLPRPEYYYEYQPYMVKVDPARLETVASGPFYWDEFLKDPDFKVPLTPDEVALAKALYDADIRRMDVVIEGLLENIVGGSDGEAESIVVITADHGEEFLEHRRWMHGAGMHHEVARIPLIVKAPDGRPGRVDGLVNLLDIPVTLASYAGLDAPAAWEGLDLRPFIAAGGELPRRELLLEGLHTILPPSEADGLNADIELNGLVSGDYYYLRDENAGVEYLYNRRRDRWERENLAAGGPGEEAAAILTRSRDAVDRSKAEVAESAFGREEMELTPALKRQLKSIGYLK